jgi:hypothetical protein
MRELTRTLDSLERFEKDRMLRLQQGSDPERLESILGEIQQKAASLNDLLAKVCSNAEEEKVADHPEILAIKERTNKTIAWVNQEMAITREKAAAVKAGQEASNEAGKTLRALFESFNDRYFQPITNLSYENNPEKAGEAFKLLAEYESKLNDLNTAISEFEARFGSNREAIDAATGDMAPGQAWESLKKAMKSVEEVPARLSGTITAAIETGLADLPKQHDFFRLTKHAEIRNLAEFARKNTPDYPGLATIDSKLAEDMKLFEAKIAEHNWPACLGKDSDRAAALEYLQNSWGKDAKNNYQVLATVITGEWSVQKHDLLGRPVMFGLPVLVALQKPEDQSKNLARVFSLTLRTPESQTASANPPFDSDTVGNSYFMPAEKVK